MENKPHPPGHSDFSEDVLLDLLAEDPRASTRDLATKMGYDHVTIYNHLKKLGKVVKTGPWIPHKLTPSNKQSRVAICNSHLSRHKREGPSFLDNLVTGDEK